MQGIVSDFLKKYDLQDKTIIVGFSGNVPFRHTG